MSSCAQQPSIEQATKPLKTHCVTSHGKSWVVTRWHFVNIDKQLSNKTREDICCSSWIILFSFMSKSQTDSNSWATETFDSWASTTFSSLGAQVSNDSQATCSNACRKVSCLDTWTVTICSNSWATVIHFYSWTVTTCSHHMSNSDRFSSLAVTTCSHFMSNSGLL